MKDRSLLSVRLHKLCDNVYFQPGTNITMTYPCIRYAFEGAQDIKADNGNYASYGRYTITNIYKSPSNALFDRLRAEFTKYFSFDRRYISDGLYHDVYTLYW